MLIQKNVAEKLLKRKSESRDKQMLLSKQSIHHALSVLRKSGISDQIDEVYLYGSCARHEQHFGSDVDLFVVLKNTFDPVSNHKDLIQILQDIQPDSLELPQIDVKFETGHQWKQKNDLYYSNIRKDGIDIWNTQKIHTNI